MKQIFILLALLLAASMSTTACAQGEEPAAPPEIIVMQEEASADANAPVLKDVRIVSEDGQQRIVKTWETAPSYDPEQLVERDFQKNGYTYKKNYLLMAFENSQQQSKLASETVTVSHEKKDGVAAQLAPLMDYNQDGYKGQLKLDTASIYTEGTGKQSYTYTITDTREYSPGLHCAHTALNE